MENKISSKCGRALNWTAIGFSVATLCLNYYTIKANSSSMEANRKLFEENRRRLENEYIENYEEERPVFEAPEGSFEDKLKNYHQESLDSGVI
jgi:hypothetical protein